MFSIHIEFTHLLTFAVCIKIMIKTTKTVQWQNVKHQYLATGAGKLKANTNRYEFRTEIFSVFLFDFVVNLAIMGYGAFEGWTSPSILLLTDSVKTPLPSGVISMEQASWIASYHCIGGLFGNIIFGYIINRYGRRLPLILITFPIIVSDCHNHQFDFRD